MKTKILLTILAIIVVGMPLNFENASGDTICLNQTIVIADEDPVLSQYEHSNKTFRKFAFDDNITTYLHLRKIGDVRVEGDFISYQCDGNGELIDKFVRWRNITSIPIEQGQARITEEEAKNIAGEGNATLFYISPDSAVFSEIEPKPLGPCWIVWERDSNGTLYEITVIDPFSGDILGYGIPPPSLGWVYSGPRNSTCTQNSSNCSDTYDAWYQSAELWFDVMGYSVNTSIYPGDEEVRSYIQNYDTALIYGIAHGSFGIIRSECCGGFEPRDVRGWIEDYPPIRFTFLASCDSMSRTDEGTMAAAFRKGENNNNNVVFMGYKNMSIAPHEVWLQTVDWQDWFFGMYMGAGCPMDAAFDATMRSYPMCIPYIAYVGDPNFRLVPVVNRTADETPNVTGEVRDVNANPLSNVEVALYEHGGGFYDSDVASSDYSIEVGQTGDYWLLATKARYYEINITGMTMLPDYWIDLSTPELLAAGYVFDFEANYGLVPGACDMGYALKSVNLWLYAEWYPEEWGLSDWKALDSIHSWQFPT